MTQLQEELLALGVSCPDVITWCSNRTLAEAWRDCERADWMLRLLRRQIGQVGWPSKQVVELCACDCAATSLPCVPADEDAPRLAIEARRRYAMGEVTEAVMREALDEAHVACMGRSSVPYAAWLAALAVGAGVPSSNAASAAAHHAMPRGSNCTAAEGRVYWAAWDAAHIRMCALIRKRVPVLPEHICLPTGTSKEKP